METRSLRRIRESVVRRSCRQYSLLVGISWSDVASQEGHGGVCFFRDVIYMLTPGKVAAYGDSQVF